MILAQYIGWSFIHRVRFIHASMPRMRFMRSSMAGLFAFTALGLAGRLIGLSGYGR